MRRLKFSQDGTIKLQLQKDICFKFIGEERNLLEGRTWYSGTNAYEHDKIASVLYHLQSTIFTYLDDIGNHHIRNCLDNPICADIHRVVSKPVDVQ